MPEANYCDNPQPRPDGYVCQGPPPAASESFNLFGCDVGCNPCKTEENFIFSFGVPMKRPGDSSPMRTLWPHPDLESRDAAGNRSPVQSHVFTRLPLRWNGWLAACYRDHPTLDQENPATRPLRNSCTCYNNRCGQTTVELVGAQATCNVYLSQRWPLRPSLGTMICMGEAPPFPGVPEFTDHVEVKMFSDRAELRQAGWSRTGIDVCKGNFAIYCWGHTEYQNTFRKCVPEIDRRNTYYDPGFPGSSGSTSAGRYQFGQLAVKGLTARFRSDAPHVDKAQVQAMNDALAWVQTDIAKGAASILGLHRLNSERVLSDGTPRGDTQNVNGALDFFWKEWHNGHDTSGFLGVGTVVTTFPGTHLRWSGCRLKDVEYVIRDAVLRLSLILHARRTSLDNRYVFVRNGVQGVFPIVRARLELTMGVRTTGLDGACPFREQSLAVQNGPQFYPMVSPSKADEIVYVDRFDRRLVPPPRIAVDFDLGPFSDPVTKSLFQTAEVEVVANRPTVCVLIRKGMDNLAIPVAKTNQHHASAAQLWTGQMTVGPT